MRTGRRRSQYEHDKLIQEIAAKYEEMGYIGIQADIDGYRSPPILGFEFDLKHRPDVYCKDLQGNPIVCEVETEDSIDDEHTVSQWTVLSGDAKKLGGQFHLVVPSGSESAAERRLKRLHIWGAKVLTV